MAATDIAGTGGGNANVAQVERHPAAVRAGELHVRGADALVNGGLAQQHSHAVRQPDRDADAEFADPHAQHAHPELAAADHVGAQHDAAVNPAGTVIPSSVPSALVLFSPVPRTAPGE